MTSSAATASASSSESQAMSEARLAAALLELNVDSAWVDDEEMDFSQVPVFEDGIGLVINESEGKGYEEQEDGKEPRKGHDEEENRHDVHSKLPSVLSDSVKPADVTKALWSSAVAGSSEGSGRKENDECVSSRVYSRSFPQEHNYTTNRNDNHDHNIDHHLNRHHHQHDHDNNGPHYRDRYDEGQMGWRGSKGDNQHSSYGREEPRLHQRDRASSREDYRRDSCNERGRQSSLYAPSRGDDGFHRGTYSHPRSFASSHQYQSYRGDRSEHEFQHSRGETSMHEESYHLHHSHHSRPNHHPNDGPLRRGDEQKHIHHSHQNHHPHEVPTRRSDEPDLGRRRRESFHSSGSGGGGGGVGSSSSSSSNGFVSRGVSPRPHSVGLDDWPQRSSSARSAGGRSYASDEKERMDIDTDWRSSRMSHQSPPSSASSLMKSGFPSSRHGSGGLDFSARGNQTLSASSELRTEFRGPGVSLADESASWRRETQIEPPAAPAPSSSSPLSAALPTSTPRTLLKRKGPVVTIAHSPPACVETAPPPVRVLLKPPAEVTKRKSSSGLPSPSATLASKDPSFVQSSTLSSESSSTTVSESVSESVSTSTSESASALASPTQETFSRPTVVAILQKRRPEIKSDKMHESRDPDLLTTSPPVSKKPEEGISSAVSSSSFAPSVITAALLPQSYASRLDSKRLYVPPVSNNSVGHGNAPSSDSQVHTPNYGSSAGGSTTTTPDPKKLKSTDFDAVMSNIKEILRVKSEAAAASATSTSLSTCTSAATGPAASAEEGDRYATSRILSQSKSLDFLAPTAKVKTPTSENWRDRPTCAVSTRDFQHVEQKEEDILEKKGGRKEEQEQKWVQKDHKQEQPHVQQSPKNHHHIQERHQPEQQQLSEHITEGELRQPQQKIRHEVYSYPFPPNMLTFHREIQAPIANAAEVFRRQPPHSHQRDGAVGKNLTYVVSPATYAYFIADATTASAFD